MKRLVKRILLALFRRMGFILRPLRNELEANLKICVAGSFDEVRVVLDDLVVEVYRLEQHVLDLRDEVARLNEARDQEIVTSDI